VTELRNVVLVGHPGSGRTTLARALGGRGEGRWLRAPGELNLLDDPALLDAADAALLVVASPQGLDGATAALWERCGEAGLPRAVCVTQLDLPRADFDETVAVLQRVLGDELHPLALPMLDDDERVAGLLSLLDLQVVDLSTGSAQVRPADPAHVALVEGLRGDLVEAVLADSEHPDLLDDYLDGAEPAPEVLRRELHDAVGRHGLAPVLAVDAGRGVGLPEVLDLVRRAFPPPGAGPAVVRPDGAPVAPLDADPSGPLVATLLGGGLLRVWSGTLAGQPLAVDGVPVAPVALTGADGEPLDACAAGDLCLAPGLPDEGLLSAADDPYLLA
jgi:elongation factor G